MLMFLEKKKKKKKKKKKFMLLRSVASSSYGVILGGSKAGLELWTKGENVYVM